MKKTKDQQLEELVHHINTLVFSDYTFQTITEKIGRGWGLFESSINLDFDFSNINHLTTILKTPILRDTIKEPENPLKENFTVLDLETKGLVRDEFIFMGGLLQREGQNLFVRQYISFSEKKEKGLIRWLKRNLKGKTLITYNGKAFDIPFLHYRASLHGISFETPQHHIDVIHIARKVFKDSFNSRKLKVLEYNVLGTWREMDVHPSLIPTLIENFQKTRKLDFLRVISRHNAYDLISTLKILEKIIEILQKEI
ncbi:MAG: ribonuclease H-like domain-containing protein [Candidatus Hydrothermia bacterium]